MNYLEKIQAFDEKNLLSLDDVLMGALELFETTSIESLDISDFKKPLITGSGNAIVTAKIIFSGIDARYCDETNFDAEIQKDIDGLIILSASGEKHATIFVKKALEKAIPTRLLTCSDNSTAGNLLGAEYTTVTPKNREPYTYNTSTYMGWVFAYTGENSSEIKDFIVSDIDPILQTIDFSKYDSYLLVTPDEFAGVNQLFVVKFIELFARKIARDVFSYGHLKHAITVVPHEGELCISFGEGELLFDGNRIHFPLPKNAKLGAIMAIGYYVIGHIQKAYPQFFKENIGAYIKKLSSTEFGKGLHVIVE